MTKAELKRLETEKKHAFIARAYATVLSCIPEQTVMLRNSVQIRLTHQSYNRYIRFHKYDKEMYLDVVGHDEHGARRYERMVEIVHTLSWRTHNEWAVDESLLRTIRTKYIIYPLMLIGNGSIVMTAETIFPLSEKHIGWVYAERTAALRQVGKTSFSASSHKAIRQMIGQAFPRITSTCTDSVTDMSCTVMAAVLTAIAKYAAIYFGPSSRSKAACLLHVRE